MQLTPRYLVNNRINIVANEAGNIITEYRPVYQRQIKVYRGIDNVLSFRLLNADQKPIDTSLYTPKFVAFDENKTMVIEHDATVLDDGSTSTRGLFTVTITENDLLNLKQQYISYNIYLVDANGNKKITYVDSHFDNNGTIFVDGMSFPGPKEPQEIVTFTQSGVDSTVYYSESVTAEPAINGNEALHTAAIYTTGYVGDITLEATLDNQIVFSGNSWVDIDTVTLTGDETAPTVINFNGIFNFIRFRSSEVPTGLITKILVKN